MKKLMIAAAIVSAAVIAQAGGVRWGSSYLNAYNDPGDYGELVDGSAVYLMSAGTVSQDAFLSALVAAGDNWESAFSTQVGSAINSGTQLETKLSAPTVGEMDGNTVIMDYSGAAAELYMVMLDSANKAVYVSEAVSHSIDDVGYTAFTFAHDGAYEGNVFEAKNGFTDGGYYNVGAVPEPTSGLLLLLGVAGLALRRRRA